MESKTCSKCNTSKSLCEFRKNKNSKDGLQSECKECAKLRNKKYYEANKEKIKETNKNWLNRNIDKMKLYYDEWSKSNPEKRIKYTKTWSDKNREQNNVNHNKRTKERRLTDPVYKLKCYLKTSIKRNLRDKGFTKNSKTHEILGCSFEEFKLHLENKFEPWMNWNNHGLYNGNEKYGWDIDHIIPISSAKTKEDVIRLNHYTNLQPLCSKINRDIKRNIIK
jgi:hypothetical protein